MLIFKYHSFGKRLFSSLAYFQVRAYFRENTVDKKSKGNEINVSESYNSYGSSKQDKTSLGILAICCVNSKSILN